MRNRISFEDLLIRISERLLSDIKNVRVSGMKYEPYVEANETAESVTLTTEINNMKPDDIRVIATENSIEIVLLEEGLEKFKGLYRTPNINPKGVRIRFNNSILEITADKA